MSQSFPVEELSMTDLSCPKGKEKFKEALVGLYKYPLMLLPGTLVFVLYVQHTWTYTSKTDLRDGISMHRPDCHLLLYV